MASPDPIVCNALWRELHTKTAPTLQWFNAWIGRVPCGSCASGTIAWVQANPSDFSSDAAFFAYGVRLHNFINSKINKPQWTLAEALARWSQPEKQMDPNDLMTPATPIVTAESKEIVTWNISGGVIIEGQGSPSAKLVDNLTFFTRRTLVPASGPPLEIRGPISTKLVSPAPVLPATATDKDKAKAAAIATCRDEMWASAKKLIAVLE